MIRPFRTLLFFSMVLHPLLALRASEGAVEENGGKAQVKAMLRLAERDAKQDPSGALSQAHTAFQFAEQQGDPALQHDALSTLAMIQERMGLYTEFLQSTLRALDLSREMGSVERIVQDLQQLSEAYRYSGRNDKAVLEARNALAMVLPTQDLVRITNAECFLMRTLLNSGDLEQARASGERNLVRCKDRPIGLGLALTHQYLGELALMEGRSAEACQQLNKALDLLGHLGGPDQVVTACLLNARALAAAGRPSEAHPFIERASELMYRANTFENRALMLTARYELSLAEKRWETALLQLQRIKQQDDSLQQARVALKMAGLQVMYQLASTEQDNADLRTRNLEQQNVIDQERARNYLLIGLIAALVVLAVALYLTSRVTVRTLRRLRLKNTLVRQQHNEIQAKNMELKRQNMRLAESLLSEEEKETVIKEIHHRVKNNLQVVNSLLGLHSGQHEDPSVGRLFKEAQGRIRSMAVVHEHIYRTGGQELGPLKAYLEQLARNILVAHGVQDRISVDVQTDEPAFPLETLMPFTLVVNELMTNAVKYAFPEGGSGQLRMIIRSTSTGYEMLFSDDGSGIRESQLPGERSFGMELIRVLADQLNGELTIMDGPGTTFRMRFAPDRRSVRVAS
jgi:two-component sensor histidine kinase